MYSQELINEFIDVTKRPKFKKYFDIASVEYLLIQMAAKSIFIEVNSIENVCRDPKDNFLLALSKDGNASHLLTGYKDLLSLKKFNQTEILLISDYILQLP